MAELIIQLQNKNGKFSCEKYDNLPSPKSVYIAICFADNVKSQKLAYDLKEKLIKTITDIESKFVSSAPPCNSKVQPFQSCKALNVNDNFKLLIVVSDNQTDVFAEKEVLKWNHTILTVLPVLKTGQNVTLPPKFKIPNASFWKKNIKEVIPIIFGIIGISDEEQKIFISYKRTDTSNLAEQLFDTLNHEGFDVFLDRFSIEPTIHFQNRLYQELSDKAMVLFLESPDYLKSEWIQYEIDFAKKYRLGLFAININSSPKTPSIDDEYRHNIKLRTLNSKLTSRLLDDLVLKIKQQHSIALFRMRNYLNNNIIAALESKGAKASFDKNGFINVLDRTGKTDYKIWATPRPPKVNDYHYSDISHTSGFKIIFGPEFQEAKRETLNTWLSKKSVVEYYNEGQILNLIDLIYP